MKENINYRKGSLLEGENFKYVKKGVSGIYIIQSDLDGKFYIGKSIDLGRRFSHHFGSLKRNAHTNVLLQEVYNEHGYDNLSFYYIEMDESELKDTEQLMLEKNGLKDKCLNLTIEGETWINNHKASSTFNSWRNKISESAKLRTGNKNPFYGKHHNEETKRKISAIHKGKVNDVARESVIINGEYYPSLGIASEKLGIHITTVSFRVNNKKAIFKNWYKSNDKNNIKYDPDFHFPNNLAKIMIVYKIEGEIYYSSEPISEKYNIKRNIVSYRIQSSNYKDWIKLA